MGVAAVPEPVGEGNERACPPVVLVTWHDAWADAEQHDSGEWRSDYLVRTTGFLVREGADIVSIAQEILPDEDGYRAVTHIPRGMVEGMTLLEPTSHRSSET
jgi:hypothetical protein